ncbi:MAG: hypothetical protein HC768_19730 [Acaryochloris sp. CRU_2_0]|nr:hypothetical protein [Acaryochloris sp. CRU_2_0]
MTIVAPALHIISDVLEWTSGGFSRFQLLINYLGFLPIPFLMLGLYVLQRPKIGWIGLLGAILYSVAFIYFTHTTLYAFEESIPDYEMLWQHLGGVYTFHGGLMFADGLLFGLAALRANVLWRGAVVLFLIGIILNLVLSLFPLPEILQIAGSTVRNLGLMGMGVGLMR